VKFPGCNKFTSRTKELRGYEFLIESETYYPVIVNFSNPYILQNDVLSELISLNSCLKIRLVIITTNYFEPSNLIGTLTQLKENMIINDFRIIQLYSKLQSPKGRPLQRYILNLCSYMEVKKIYLETRPVLSLFHSTNELADLIGIKISQEIDSKIGILRPTACDMPEEIQVRSNSFERGNISLAVFRKAIYFYEKITKALIHFLVLNSLNLKDVNSKGFHASEISDFALCSNLHDANLLSKQIKSKVIDVVDFSPQLEDNPEITGSFILILLPFLEDIKAGELALTEIRESNVEALSDSKKIVYIKHHPRTSEQIQENFRLCFKTHYPNDDAHPVFTDLDDLVAKAKSIICVGETSATYFAYKRNPEKVILTRKTFLEKYLEPQSTISPTLSEYLVTFLNGKSK
jgi:hypothetical protein